MLPVGEGALYGEKMEGTNREGHEGPRREAHSRRGTIKLEGGAWGNGGIDRWAWAC
jgi:hypothetical protein